MWYLQYHRTCVWLCHSLILTLLFTLAGSEENLTTFTLERQSLFASHWQSQWLNVKSYRGNGETNSFSAGDRVRLDASLQYRLWPKTLTSDSSGFLYGVLESNVLFRQKNRINSQSDQNSGGTQWFITPGLQYVTRRWVVEAAVQIPVVQQLNGTALENSTIVRTGFRFNF